MKGYSEESRKKDREWIEKQKEFTRQRTSFGMGSALLFGLFAIVICIAVVLSGCTNPKETVSEESIETATPIPVTVATETPTASPEEQWAFVEYDWVEEESVTRLLNLYRDVLSYNYGVEEDLNDYLTDENGNHFYHVTNFSNKEEVLSYLRTFSLEDYENDYFFNYCFKEQDGKLYHGQPVMGITTYRQNPDWEYEDNTVVTVPFETADGYLTDNMHYRITFDMLEGEWYIDSCELITE